MALTLLSKDIRFDSAQMALVNLLLSFNDVSHCVVLDLFHSEVDQAELDEVLLVSEVFFLKDACHLVNDYIFYLLARF